MMPTYELLLSKTAASAECYGEGPAEGMTLTLKSVSSEATQIEKVLQQDSSTLPKSRGCATGYEVTKVVKSGKSLLIAVQYSTPGFEGPNQETIAVTAQVDLK